MLYLKDEYAVGLMREAGHRLAKLFIDLRDIVKEGVSTLEIDSYIEKFIVDNEMKPVCKGYFGYKHASCISINDEVVHGVPSFKKKLVKGDLVKIDVVASFNGYCADMARGFEVGSVSDDIKKLNLAARNAFLVGISKLRPNVFLGQLSLSIQKYIEQEGFHVVREFVGHGIGKNMHEEPEVPNFFSIKGKNNIRLVPGMVLAIEPMLLEKPDSVVILEDGWTAKSRSGYWASHYEDTVVITKKGCEVLTEIY